MGDLDQLPTTPLSQKSRIKVIKDYELLKGEKYLNSKNYFVETDNDSSFTYRIWSWQSDDIIDVSFKFQEFKNSLKAENLN